MLRRVHAALAATAVVVSLTVGVDVAGACSCAFSAPSERLAEGSPALVGTVTAKREVGPIGDPPMGTEYDYTVAVERAFNADLPQEITLRGNTMGAACGFSATVGQRIGAFLNRDGDQWATNSCSLVAPDELIAAADAAPPPPPVVHDVIGGATDSWMRLRTSYGKTTVPGKGRLTVRPKGRIAIRVDSPARAVRVTLAGPRGKPLDRSRAASRKNDGRSLWTVRLPREIRPRAKRLDVAVSYSDGSSATFVVALTVKRPDSRAACAGRQPS